MTQIEVKSLADRKIVGKSLESLISFKDNVIIPKRYVGTSKTTQSASGGYGLSPTSP